jgi:hypothetical protein
MFEKPVKRNRDVILRGRIWVIALTAGIISAVNPNISNSKAEN